MNILRPIIVFDLEVTGLDFKTERIIDIAAVKVLPDGNYIEKFIRLNPEVPIPQEATEVHGITDDDVKDRPTFRQASRSIWEFFHGCDLSGFFIMNFDISFMSQEFYRVGSRWPDPEARIIDTHRILKLQERRTLTWAHKFYLNKEFDNPHAALSDAWASLRILDAQADKYKAQSVEDLLKLQAEPSWLERRGGAFKKTDNGLVLNFGRHSTEYLSEVPFDYLEWLRDQSFIDDESLVVIEDEMLRRANSTPQDTPKVQQSNS